MTMCILQIQARSENKFLEVIPDERVTAELAIEDIVGHLLLDLFGEAEVDDVTIHFPPTLYIGLKQCFIRICASCACDCFAEQPRSKEHITIAIEKRIGPVLKEFFGQVNVDSVTLSPSQGLCSYAACQ